MVHMMMLLLAGYIHTGRSLVMAAIKMSSTGLETPISLHRTFGNGAARSRLTLVRSRSAPAVPSSIFVRKKKIAKVATKKVVQMKHIQAYNKPPLAVKRQISDELGASAYNDCAKVLHSSPFDTMFWEATSTLTEVQSEIEDAWNSLAEIIVSHVNVFSDSTTIEQCECPPPNLNDVDDDELFGLEFLEEGEANIGPFDYSLVGLEMEEEPLHLQVAAEQ